MKKIMLISVAVTSLLVMLGGSFALTGLFNKVLTEDFSSGEFVDKNFTIRKFYNLTARIQKENSTSYLTIRNNFTSIIFTDVNYNEIKKLDGFDGTAHYSIIDKKDLDKIKYVSTFNVSNSRNYYQDVFNQSVEVIYSGTRATFIIKVVIGEPPVVEGLNSTLTGYIIDDLTNQRISGIEIYSFQKNSDPTVSDFVVKNSTDENGKFFLNFEPGSYDFYIEDYNLA